jgi:hypothetical protein
MFQIGFIFKRIRGLIVADICKKCGKWHGGQFGECQHNPQGDKIMPILLLLENRNRDNQRRAIQAARSSDDETLLAILDAIAAESHNTLELVRRLLDN